MDQWSNHAKRIGILGNRPCRLVTKVSLQWHLFSIKPSQIGCQKIVANLLEMECFVTVLLKFHLEFRLLHHFSNENKRFQP